MKNPVILTGTPPAFSRISHMLMLVLLAPVLVIQARRTARRTPRLARAGGTDRGTVAGMGPAIRLVVIGESTAAGVGATAHAEALPGFLATALQDRLHRSVLWSVHGRRGATARKVTSEIVPALGAAPDLIVVTIGINDLIRRRPLKLWSTDLTDLIAALRTSHPHATLIFAGMPPVHRFPAIPQPLRLVLGARARAMDRLLHEAAHEGGATYVAMNESMARDRRLFAADGFHPSTAGYRVWAHDLARVV